MNSEIEKPKVIVWGTRDKPFKKTIVDLLWNGRGKEKQIKDFKEHIKQVLNENGMNEYNKAFTHRSANENDNYEVYEQLGDVTVNKSIVWYLYRRFPQLKCPEGVKVVARLRINLVSKKSFATFGEKLGFWNFVSADEETKRTKMKKTLEDVFEAFFGVTEMLFDTIQMGMGYKVCYNIIEYLFNQEQISLKYCDLYDAKTRLKETFDCFAKQGIGQMKFSSETKEVTKDIWESKGGQGNKITYHIHDVTVFQKIGLHEIPLGKGSASLKADAEQRASDVALKTLAQKGFKRPIPKEYAKFDSM